MGVMPLFLFNCLFQRLLHEAFRERLCVLSGGAAVIAAKKRIQEIIDSYSFIISRVFLDVRFRAHDELRHAPSKVERSEG